MGALARACAVAVVLLVGCGGESAGSGSSSTSSGGMPMGCAPGEVVLESGACEPAGVPADACGQGFESDGNRGCRAILPAADCPKGQMAMLGETSCHEVAPCGSGTWGDIPIDAATVFVDAAYAGGASDGSQANPWATVQAGVDHASSGALVAIAAGSYAESVVIAHPVHLFGVCPKSVEIVSAQGSGAIVVQDGADGTEIHALAVRGAVAGIAAVDVANLLVKNVWIHDTSQPALELEGATTAASARIEASLVESTQIIGLYTQAGTLDVEGCVVRDIVADTTLHYGRGVDVESTTSRRAKATIARTLIERATDIGVYAGGADVTIDASYVYGTRVEPADQRNGFGFADEPLNGNNATFTATGSVFEGNRGAGGVVIGSTLTMDASVVRDTGPGGVVTQVGRGLQVEDNAPASRSTVTLTRSLFDANHDGGVVVIGSDATLTATLIRGTLPNATDMTDGITFATGNDLKDGERAKVAITSCAFEGGHIAGVVDFDSDMSIDASAIRGVQPQASDGLYGDGLVLASDATAANATLGMLLIEGSPRAGISNFGAIAVLRAVSLECNEIDLDGEPGPAEMPSFTDQGGNTCGCKGVSRACKILSSGLTVPPPPALL